VDDDPASRELLERTLEGDGFSVVTASSGEQGLELARKLKPSLMTLDVLMPSMDGWTVLQEVKADPELRNIPVLMISIAGDKDMGYTLGAVESLTKPVDRDKLRELARQYSLSAGGGRALVVDDDEGIRSLFQRALTEDGWEVDEAENGAIALEKVAKNRPDLVLLDLMMPVMDGFDALPKTRGVRGDTDYRGHRQGPRPERKRKPVRRRRTDRRKGGADPSAAFETGPRARVPTRGFGERGRMR
jgi:CheY-like chemotaxis protein